MTGLSLSVPNNRSMTLSMAGGAMQLVAADLTEIAGYADDAALSAAQAEAAQATIEAIVINDLGTSDGQMAAVAATPSSAFAQQQSALFGTELWVTALGAKCDAKFLSDVVTTNGSAVITSASAGFTSADVGKKVSLRAGSTAVTTTIASRQSTTQVTLGTTVGSTGTGRYMDYGTDDTAAWLAVCAAVKPAGTIRFAGRSLVTQEIPGGDYTIRGSGCSEITKGIGESQGGSGPDTMPVIRGSVIVQITAATNGVAARGIGDNFHCRDFGVWFGAGIMFKNTGHGFYGASDSLYLGGPGHNNGPFNSRWDNLYVAGHDGNHYAYYLRNCNLGTYSHLRFQGGGGLYYGTDTTENPFGNCVITGMYGRKFVGGTAHGYTLEGNVLGGATPGLNLMTLIRPQCNILPMPGTLSGLGIAVPDITNYLFKAVGPAGSFKAIDIIDPDLENDGVTAFPIDFGGVSSGITVRNHGILASAAAVGGFSTGDRATPGVYTLPVLTPGPGAGTGASVTVVRGDDRAGILTITTGTSPGAAESTVVATFTWATLPSNGPVAIFLTGFGNKYADLAGFFPCNVNDGAKTFEIRAGTQLVGPGGTYQLSYHLLTDRD